jgi:hypothetical protein
MMAALPSPTAEQARPRSFRASAAHFLAHDRRDHLEGGGVADAGREEQQMKLAKKRRRQAALDAEEVEHTDHAEPSSATNTQKVTRRRRSVGDPAGQRARQRADQRPEEGDLQHVDVRELRLGQQREAAEKPMKEPKVPV